MSRWTLKSSSKELAHGNRMIAGEGIMPISFDGKLVVAISSRALFDLDESHALYEREGVDSYTKHQIAHEDSQLIVLAGTSHLREPILRMIGRLLSGIIELPQLDEPYLDRGQPLTSDRSLGWQPIYSRPTGRRPVPNIGQKRSRRGLSASVAECSPCRSGHRPACRRWRRWCRHRRHD